MNNTFLIGIDSGKSFTKSVWKNENKSLERVKFQTKVAEVRNSSTDLPFKSDFVNYNNKLYAIGEMLSETHINYDLTKQTHEHLICIYLAITKILDKSTVPIALANIHLAINTPLSLYLNEKKKNEYEDYIRQDGRIIGLEVNKQPYSFRIASITVLPEGIGPIYYNVNDFREKRCTLVDIGSLNVNFLQVNNLVPQHDSMATATLGINILRAKITEALVTEYGIAFSDDDVEQILRDRCVYLYGEKQIESEKLIEQIISDHVKQIFNYAKSRKISLQNITFVGGGSVVLKEYLLQQYPSISIYSDAQFGNVLSYLRILEAKQNDKGA